MNLFTCGTFQTGVLEHRKIYSVLLLPSNSQKANTYKNEWSWWGKTYIFGELVLYLQHKLMMSAYLDGVIIGLAGFCIRLVWHEPRLQQVLIKTVPESTNWGVIWRQRKEEFKREEWRNQDQDKEEKQWDAHKWGSQKEFSIFWLATDFKGTYRCSRWFYFSSPTIYWHILSFPVMFTHSLMCSHFSVPSCPHESLHSFHPVLICRTPQREDGTEPEHILIRLRK